MINPIKQIYDWNNRAGLLDKPYDDFLESSFQIEEALEGFGDLHEVAIALNKESFDICKSASPKDVARGIVFMSQSEIYKDGEGTGEVQELSDVDRLDKACDAVVFAVGSMGKLGLNPQQITRALNIVMDANIQKLSMPKDKHGKLMKPADFVGPEPRLQALLDERNSHD